VSELAQLHHFWSDGRHVLYHRKITSLPNPLHSTAPDVMTMSQSPSSTCRFTPWSSEVWLTAKFLPCNPTVYCLVAAILAISYWLVIELTCEVYFTFKRHDSFYFWSIAVSIWGVALRATGWTLQNWIVAMNPNIWTTLMIVGGTAMVAGFLFVLYSRLHLVIRHQRILNFVLAFICVNAVAFTVPLAVAFYGLDSDDPMKFLSLILPADPTLRQRIFCPGSPPRLSVYLDS
jgi:hypothetical protein